MQQRLQGIAREQVRIVAAPRETDGMVLLRDDAANVGGEAASVRRELELDALGRPFRRRLDGAIDVDEPRWIEGNERGRLGGGRPYHHAHRVAVESERAHRST